MQIATFLLIESRLVRGRSLSLLEVTKGTRKTTTLIRLEKFILESAILLVY